MTYVISRGVVFLLVQKGLYCVRVLGSSLQYAFKIEQSEHMHKFCLNQVSVNTVEIAKSYGIPKCVYLCASACVGVRLRASACMCESAVPCVALPRLASPHRASKQPKEDSIAITCNILASKLRFRSLFRKPPVVSKNELTPRRGQLCLYDESTRGHDAPIRANVVHFRLIARCAVQ